MSVLGCRIEGRPLHGFRGGNYNTYVTNATGFNLYKPEALTDFEGGAKTDLFDGHLAIDISAFHYNYKNLQVTILQNTGTVTTNAAKAESNGFEAAVQSRPLENLLADFSIGVQDSHYTAFRNASAP